MIAQAEKKTTVNEFLEMDFEEGFIYELINGEIMKRTSPNLDHQDASMMLSTFLNNYILANKLGKLFAAPTDVYITEFDLVVPDLSFVSNNNKDIMFERRCIVGVPDLIIEILSKGTKGVDRKDKMTVYCKNGVKEYWIVDPKSEYVEIYVLENGIYNLMTVAEENDEFQSTVLEGFKMNVKDIFNL
jgi:Uma2 family endonuclease